MEFLVTPAPFVEAIKKANQFVVGSPLSASEWKDVNVALRDNAFFSSRIENAKVLQKGKDLIGDFLASNREALPNGDAALKVGSRAAFVDQMQEFLAANGIERTTGDLKDIASETRLGLIFDIKTQQAQGYGYWRQGMDSDVLDEFPASRFIRVADVKEPRQSHAIYENQVYLKTDPIWSRVINEDFGVPWPPFGWGCMHDIEDVDRAETEALGLLQPGEKIDPPEADLNENLQASTKNIEPELLDKLREAFGAQAVFEGDTVRWLGQPSAKVGEELTSKDLAAVQDYTAPTLHTQINDALREAGAAAPLHVKKEADAISTALAKLSDYRGEVYRGVDVTDSELAESKVFYQPGNVVTERAFTSAATDRSGAHPGRLRFEIVSKTGKSLSDYSKAVLEDEILFDQGTQFKVLEARWHGGALHVKLEEL